MSKDEDKQIFKDEAEIILKDCYGAGKDCEAILTIIMIISVIVSILRLIQACRKDVKTVQEDAQNTKVSKLLIKRGIVRAIGLWGYKQHGEALTNAILARRDTISTKRLQDLLSALDK